MFNFEIKNPEDGSKTLKFCVFVGFQRLYPGFMPSTGVKTLSKPKSFYGPRFAVFGLTRDQCNAWVKNWLPDGKDASHFVCASWLNGRRAFVPKTKGKKIVFKFKLFTDEDGSKGIWNYKEHIKLNKRSQQKRDDIIFKAINEKCKGYKSSHTTPISYHVQGTSHLYKVSKASKYWVSDTTAGSSVLVLAQNTIQLHAKKQPVLWACVAFVQDPSIPLILNFKERLDAGVKEHQVMLPPTDPKKGVVKHEITFTKFDSTREAARAELIKAFCQTVVDKRRLPNSLRSLPPGLIPSAPAAPATGAASRFPAVGAALPSRDAMFEKMRAVFSTASK